MLDLLKWFNTYWKQKKIAMVLVVLLTVFTIAAKVAFPLFLKFIIDELTVDYKPAQVIELIAIYVIFAFIHELFRMGLPLFRGYLNLSFAAMIRSRYFNIISGKSSIFFKKFKTGDLLTRLTDDIDGQWVRIFWYSSSGILRPLEAILILTFTLGVMLYYSVSLTLYTFLPIPILVLIASKMGDKILQSSADTQKATSECNNILDACISGIRIIKSTISEKAQYGKYVNAVKVRVEKEKKLLLIQQLLHFFTMLVNHIGTITVIFIGSYYVIQGKITLGTLIIFIRYLRTLIEPIWTLSFFYGSTKQIMKYVDRLKELDENDDFERVCTSENSLESIVSIELKDVSFKYHDSDEYCLKNISLKIEKGMKIALVGAVGAGKSTLLNLVTGDLEPESGEILINGKNIKYFNKELLQKKIGYIRQENLLFSESIEENIILGDSFSKEEVTRSLQIAGVLDEVEFFGEGISTVLGQKGIGLSGGQKQRISMSRTLIRDPDLLLMDDCTAAMDAQTEKEFWESFKDNYPNTMCLVVTHRSATARKVDQINVLHDRTIKEQAHYHELSKENTLYQKLMNELR